MESKIEAKRSTGWQPDPPAQLIIRIWYIDTDNAKFIW